ncbi:unannotated protein [freshwater metagenome]|uniref:Unannotated protein n=1 Tax=freshwater metagenome TaxID=449393 RepID=A0A6J6SS03_9ZZZZ
MTVQVLDDIDELEARVRAAGREPAALHAALDGRRAVDVARVIDRLGGADRVAAFAAVASPVAARVLHEAGAETAKAVMGSRPLKDAAALLDRLPMDEAARVLAGLGDERSTELLAAMTPRHAAEVRSLLAHPAKSIFIGRS